MSSYDPVIQDILRHSKTTRYKALVVVGASLKELSQFAVALQTVSPGTRAIDGLKIIKTGQLKQIADPLSIKYWLYNQPQPTVLNGFIHFDWIVGRWSRQQAQEWWQLLAQMEIPLVVCTILKPPLDYWQEVTDGAMYTVSNKLSFFRPTTSRFSKPGQ